MGLKTVDDDRPSLTRALVVVVGEWSRCCRYSAATTATGAFGGCHGGRSEALALGFCLFVSSCSLLLSCLSRLAIRDRINFRRLVEHGEVSM